MSLVEYKGILSLVSIGYQGPVSNENSEEYPSLHDFAKQNNVITGFIRFNPLTENHDGSSKSVSSCHIADFSDIHAYLNTRPGRLRSVMRNTPPKYSYSMQQSIIDKSLQYNNEFFCSKSALSALCSSEMGVLINSIRNDEITASSLFLEAGNTAVYAANASNAVGKQYSDNAFILLEYIEHARERHITHLYLGSGIDNSDSLELFKKQFSTVKYTVYHEHIIFDQDSFNLLKSDDPYFPPWLHNICIPGIIRGMQMQ